MEPNNPRSFGVAPQNTQGVNSWVPPRPTSTPSQSSQTPLTPRPPVEPLTLGEFEVTEARFSLRYLLIGASITVIVASLLTAYLSSSQKAVASQYSKKYDTEIALTLKSPSFLTKQTAVENAGTSIANLQTELSSRVKFSNFFSELSNVTYKNSRITRLIINSQGEVTLEGTVASFNDLAKFASSLRSSTKFNDVKVLSAEKQTDGQVVFSVTFTASSSLLKK